MPTDLKPLIIKFLKKNPRGACIGDIAKALDVNRITVSIALAELKGAQIVDFQSVGPTKLYFLKSSRVSV